jgi:hypothetical protein
MGEMARGSAVEAVGSSHQHSLINSTQSESLWRSEDQHGLSVP